MANNSVKVSSLLNLRNLTSAPLNPQAGDVYFDSSLNSFQFYNGTAWQTYLLPDGSVPLTADLDMGGFKVINLADPTLANDAATKSYVDAAANGFSWKNPARVASTASVPLSGATPLIIDGITLDTNDRVLLKNQTTGAGANVDNGIYVYAIAGANYTLARSADADTDTELLQAALFVTSGTTQSDSGWVGTANSPIVIGTTPLPFVLFASGSGNANAALSNLIATSINQTLKPNADITFDLGTSLLSWNNLYAGTVNTNSISPRNVGLATTVFSSDSALALSSGNRSTGATGAVTLLSGNNSGTTASGLISLTTGNTAGAAGPSGAVSIITGNAALGASGSITIQTGTAGTTRGDIALNSRQMNFTTSSTMNFTTGFAFNFGGGSINSTYGQIVVGTSGITGLINAAGGSGATQGSQLRVSGGDYNGSNTDMNGGALSLRSGVYSGKGVSKIEFWAGVSTFPSNGSGHSPQQIGQFYDSCLTVGPTFTLPNPGVQASIFLSATDRALLLNSVSTGAQDGMVAYDGMILYNVDDEVFRVFSGGWRDLVTVVPGSGVANDKLSNLSPSGTQVSQSLLPISTASKNLGSSSKMWLEAWAEAVYTTAINDASSQNDVLLVTASSLDPAGNGSISLGSSTAQYLNLYTRSASFYTPSAQSALLSSGVAAPDANVTGFSVQLLVQDSALGILTASNNANDASNASSILIETGNKTDGTGGSGSILLQTGTAVGGLRGAIVISGSVVQVSADFGINFTAALSMGDQQINMVADPSSDQDAVNLRYAQSRFAHVTPDNSQAEIVNGFALNVPDAASTTMISVTARSFIINYQVVRGSVVQTGQLMMSNDGVTAEVADISSSVGTAGITFTATVAGGIMDLVATATSTGTNASLSYITAFLAV